MRAIKEKSKGLDAYPYPKESDHHEDNGDGLKYPRFLYLRKVHRWHSRSQYKVGRHLLDNQLKWHLKQPLKLGRVPHTFAGAAQVSRFSRPGSGATYHWAGRGQTRIRTTQKSGGRCHRSLGRNVVMSSARSLPQPE